VPSLDVDRIGLETAREVDGRASVLSVGGWLFVASASAPVIERFQVEADGSLTSTGRLSFANYGLPAYFSIDAWGSVPISPTKAYLFNGSDGSHVIWNPTTFEITGEIPGPDILLEGWKLESSPGVVRGTRMYRTFSYLDYDAWKFKSDVQYLAVYDIETDQLLSVVEERRCPLLYSRPFTDERNDIYFSGWVWTVAETIVNGGPKNCALRIRDGEDSFDPGWQLTYSDEVTSGREAGILRYVGNGRALLDVFHHDEINISPEATSQEVSYLPQWRLWSIDLEQKTGAPLDGLGFKAAGYMDAPVDGRTFLLVPNDSYSETSAYEAIDGNAAPRFQIQGSSYHMVKLR
jgi:hypothetical protein